jgi:phosphatidylinositol alpha-mannosyltransferase
LKIALVSPYDYSFPGGVVQHISHLAHYYQQWGHQVKIIAPCLKEGTQYFEEEVYSIGRPFPLSYGGTVARLPLSPWLPAQVRHVLHKEKFDVIHLHEPFLPMLCLSILMQSRALNVGTFHAYYAGAKSYDTVKPLFKKFLTRLDGKIVVSQPLFNFLNKYAPSNYRIIPNGIDIERFTLEGPVKKEYLDGKVNILFVGRLEKRKGLEYLIQACGLLNKKFSNFRLIVVGPGTRLRGGYRRLAKELELENVEFVGFASGDELPMYYRTADIFCAPATKGESFGIVLLEAMACGKPVIASDIDGYASVMHHTEDGILVPPKDAQGLSDALLWLVENRSLREKMGQKGRANAEKYSWPNISQRVLDFYREIENGSS